MHRKPEETNDRCLTVAANAMYAVASRIFADAYKPREITRTSCSWCAWVDCALARRRTAEDTLPALEAQTVSESYKDPGR